MKLLPRIAFVGDLTVDRYVRQNEIHLGGSSLTGAIWATRLGAKSSVVAAVGDDDAGREYISMLSREHIDSSHLKRMPGKTSSIDILTADDGERQYGTWDPGVLASWNPDAADYAFLRNHDAVVVAVYDKTVHILDAFDRAFGSYSDEHPLRVVDFGDMTHFGKRVAFVEKYLPAIDVAVFGLDRERDRTFIDGLRHMSSVSGKLYVVTLNRHGAIAFQKDRRWDIPARNTPVVDATGAGDSFLAGFLVSFLHTEDIETSLQQGRDIATNVIGKVGAY